MTQVLNDEVQADIVEDSIVNLALKEANLQAAIPERKKALRDFSSVFFDPVRLNDDDHFRSPICAAADIMRQQGITGKALRCSLLSVLTMYSPRLG